MSTDSPQCRAQVIENEIHGLTSRLADLHRELHKIKATPAQPLVSRHKWRLEADEYRRYGRQMILPEIGRPGQLRLRDARVLIIGLGGLGCPAAQYLAAAGVGCLGLLDADNVELSNLHRQVLHSISRIGQKKVHSAWTALRDLNPRVQYNVHAEYLCPQNALQIIEQNEYNLILDCTDRPATRYLISDAAVLAVVPLVSASALRTDGQLLVLNHPPSLPGGAGPGHCYRCVFPQPPAPDLVDTCGEAGILGPVVGVMGVLMAVEAIKLLASGDVHANRMLHYSAYSASPLRSLKLFGKRPDCAACGLGPRITRDTFTNEDYARFCGTRSSVNVDSGRVCPANVRTEETIIDVRPATEFDIAHIHGSINLPISSLRTDPSSISVYLSKGPICFVCKYGNDSQEAVAITRSALDEARHTDVRDMVGGLRGWREVIDTDFPDY